MNRPAARLGLALLLFSSSAAALLGCSTAAREQAGVLPGAGWLGAEGAPSSVLTVRDAYPFVALADDEPVPGAEIRGERGALVSRWEVLEGEHAGRVIREERTPAGPRTWRVRSILEDGGEILEVRVLRFEEATGALILADMEQTERGVRVVMRPAPASMPAELLAGGAVAQEMSLRMPYLSNPRRLRAEGKGRMTLIYDADQSMTVGGRTLDARRLREEFTTNVTAAKAVRTIERWFVPGLGMVAERWEEEVRVLGLASERSRQTVRLLPP